MKTPIEDKVSGCLWGIVVGDALGAPVEGYSSEKIAKLHNGRLTEYKKPIGHKWFDDQPLGFHTDDTQLSFAIVKALLEANKFDMDVIAKHHVEAMDESAKGWGYSTQDSIRLLRDGIHWSQSGFTSNPERGTGNGIPMKIAPIALFDYLEGKPQYRKIVQFAAMTHYTEISVYAALAHYHAICYCLSKSLADFDKNEFLQEIVNNAYVKGFVEHARIDPPLSKSSDNLRDRLNLLFSTENTDLFERNGCYVYESLPFTYAHFLENPTIEGFYNVINAGGDTDTNGSMFGSMLGALHGITVFPSKLLAGIHEKEKLDPLVLNFVRKFVKGV